MGSRRFRRIVFLLVFALIDAGVIVYGVHVHNSSHNATPPAVIAPVTPVPATTHTPRPVPLSQSAAKVRAATLVPDILLGAWNVRNAWRAIGYCAQVSSLIYTQNSGSTWSQITQPAPYILWMHETGSSHGWVVGANSSCTSATKYTTTDRGKHWTAAPGLGHIWLPTVIGIRTPSGGITLPCGSKHPSPISFSSAGVAGDAVAVCLHGVFRSTNGGHSWLPTGPVTQGKAGAVALTKSGAGVLLMTGEHHCSGVRVLRTDDSGATWTVGSCLRIGSPPVTVSLADSGAGIMLSVGSRYLTQDFGGTWD